METLITKFVYCIALLIILQILIQDYVKVFVQRVMLIPDKKDVLILVHMTFMQI